MTGANVALRFSGGDYRLLVEELEEHLASLQRIAARPEAETKLGTNRRAFMEKIERLEGLIGRVKG